MITHAEHILFTDGSSLGNPGPGGWGAVLVLSGDSTSVKATADRRVIEMGGGEKKTTNNRMELQALIEGLARMTNEKGDLTIYLDSSYVHKGATEWSHAWQKNNWQTTAKKDVENRDLWEQLLPLLENRKQLGKIMWKHITGHSGIVGNERADAIATGFAKGDAAQLFEGALENYTVDILNTAIDDAIADKRHASRAHARAQAYSYVSLVNGKAMRHRTWAECEKRVKGKSGVRYKKALSPKDEQKILREWNAHL